MWCAAMSTTTTAGDSNQRCARVGVDEQEYSMERSKKKNYAHVFLLFFHLTGNNFKMHLVFAFISNVGIALRHHQSFWMQQSKLIATFKTHWNCASGTESEVVFFCKRSLRKYTNEMRNINKKKIRWVLSLFKRCAWFTLKRFLKTFHFRMQTIKNQRKALIKKLQIDFPVQVNSKLEITIAHKNACEKWPWSLL